MRRKVPGFTSFSCPGIEKLKEEANSISLKISSQCNPARAEVPPGGSAIASLKASEVAERERFGLKKASGKLLGEKDQTNQREQSRTLRAQGDQLEDAGHVSLSRLLVFILKCGKTTPGRIEQAEDRFFF